MKTSEQTKRYWRSMADLERTPEFDEMMEKEFLAGPEEEWTAPTRRRFLQLMGASLALSTASCRWEKERILPLANRPEGRIPGASEEFASVLEFSGWAQGITLTCVEGRPVKVEGNKLHPVSQGGSTAVAQAATLEMYDPDRSRGVATVDGELQVESSWAAFESANSALRDGDGSDLLVLTTPSNAPHRIAAKSAFQAKFPNATWLDCEAGHRGNEQDGCAMAFGQACRPDYQIAAADVMLTLDDDLLTDHPSSTRYARDFSSRRRPEDGKLSRLWSVEADFTVTGTMADERLPLRSGLIGAFLAKLEFALVAAGLEHPDAGAVSDPALAVDGMDAYMKALVSDLMGHKGSSMISVGPLQPADVHARAQRLNVLLGAAGKTVHYLPAAASVSSPEEVRAAMASVKAGAFKAFFVLDCNPAYLMPGALGFGEAVAAFRTAGGKLIHAGLYRDETAKLADWHLPVAHAFEAWTDAVSWDGTHSVGQPTLQPLYGGRTVAELLSWIVKEQKTSRELVRAGLAVDDKTWRRVLHDGVVADSANAAVQVSAKAMPAYVAGDLTVAPANGSMEVRFMRDRRIGDGRQANMGWLQELPDPMTTLTWDNAALMSFATAESLGVKHESMVKLELDGRSIEMPVYLMPGHADGSVSLQLGFGRTAAGHVAGLNDDEVDTVGFDVNPLRGSAALAIGLTVTALGGRYKLALTQDHFAIDEIGQKGRDERLPELVKEGTVADFEEQPRFAKSAADFWGKDSNLWTELDPETDPLLEKPKHKWGMAIDLSTCTGCSACTIACQSENNIPVVGKDQVLKGREMHWIRMDRYFSGDKDDSSSIEAMSQPIACQHCEMAPCESVCPVAATTHSSEGLNDMVYNRCIGTRYCANNCPYKVRRFNYFDYNKDADVPGNEVLKMSANPEVTVRSRGVMEKCTMCVQRIEKARITTRNADRETHIPDGSFEVACQQACPSGSIVFGDLMDENSAIRKAHENPRSYALLAELNNKPRNVFLARIRNPHPDLVDVGEEVVSHG